MTFSAPIFVRARFMNATTGEIKEQTVFMGDFPMMTDKGTFVINGTERVVVSQLVRSPGVIFQPGERFRLRNLTKHQLVTGTIHPYRGEWIEFDVEQKPGKDVTAGCRVARKRRLSLFVLLRALGYDEENHPGFLETLRAPLRLPRGPVGEGSRAGAHPGRGAGRDLQAGPPGRAAVGRVGPRLLPQRVLREPPLRPQPRRSLQAQPQARPRARQDRADLRHRRSSEPEHRPAGAHPGRGPRGHRPTCCTWSTPSRATASTTRTTSPTAASARSASSSRTRSASASPAWSGSSASA